MRRNMTDAERCLWSRIRHRQLKGLRFLRQRPIGSYIVDFYCPDIKLVIEVDGGQHYIKEMEKRDQIRENYLHSLGLRILRFNNLDVLKNIDGVVDEILEHLG